MVSNFKTLFITILIFGLSDISQATDIKDLLSLAEGEHIEGHFHSPTKSSDIRKVVIDAGHGGHDGGCHGKMFNEKDLALKMALKLGALIRANYSDVEVIYTRTKDVFIPLHERIGLANKEKADLFISIHCNWISNSKTKGTETFVMGLHRANDNLEVAKRENSAILLESDFDKNYEGYDPNSSVGHIMLTMYQDAYLNQSIEFASHVEKSLKTRGYTTSRGVKQAGFAVLRRATMPSVLIEAGFLSNEDEERFLGSEEGQDQVAASIFGAFKVVKDNGATNERKDQIAVSKLNPHPQDEVVASLDAKMPSNKDKGYEKPKPKSEVNEKIVVTSVANKTTKVDSKTTIEIKPTLDTKPKDEVALSTIQKQTEPSVETNSNLPVYRVQIAALKKDIKKQLEGDQTINKLGMVVVLKKDDLFKYQIGDFDTVAAATKAKEQLVAIGYKTAFLTTVY